jgi:protein JSN1
MNNFYPNMQSGFGGYSSGSPSVEHYRNQTNPVQPQHPQMNPSPIIGQSSFGPPGFGNIGVGINAYGYTGMGMQGMGYGMQQEQQVNSRRGRVR